MDTGSSTACEIVRTLVRRQDQGDVDGYAAGFAADGEFRHPAATVRGRAEIRAFIAGYAEAFPDGRHEITAMLESDGVVAMEGTYTGTNTGPMRTPAGELPPTGRSVTIRWAGFARLHDGLVVRLHGYYDQLAFLGQLGLVPEPAAA
jgi:steroid delta-isomerase-like uncharacterized protein